jgi:hypothetical protein
LGPQTSVSPWKDASFKARAPGKKIDAKGAPPWEDLRNAGKEREREREREREAIAAGNMEKSKVRKSERGLT